MAVEQRLSEAAYEQVVRSGPDGAWELHDGRLVEKPGMTWEHGRIAALISHFLQLQLDLKTYEVRINEGRVRKPSDTIYIPDVLVVPTAYGEPFRNRPGTLAIFADPLPLVIEVWAASTGEYDIDAKLPVYQQRGDQEIWLVHPYEGTLTAWRRQADGSYEAVVYRDGVVRPVALPEVAITLAALFET